MKSRKPRIEISKQWLEQFCKTHYIVRLALFGSVLSDHFSETSDIDILVEFDPSHIPGLFAISAMKEELTKNLGRDVDLRTLEDISKLFRQNILEDSYQLYEQQGFKSA